MKDATFVGVLSNTMKIAQSFAEVNKFLKDGHLYLALYHVRCTIGC